MHLVLFLFPCLPPNSSFRLPPWLSVPRFLAEIKLICIMKVGPSHCTGLKKTAKKKKRKETTFIRGQTGVSYMTSAKVKERNKIQLCSFNKPIILQIMHLDCILWVQECILSLDKAFKTHSKLRWDVQHCTFVSHSCFKEKKVDIGHATVSIFNIFLPIKWLLIC